MSEEKVFGVVPHDASSRRTDFLYRVSLKCLIRNDAGEVLVVKEAGRTWWDLPGGGMDHGESIKAALAREMKEEVNLAGGFAHEIIAVDEPKLLGQYSFWQIRLIFELHPDRMDFSPGEDGDEVAFMDPASFKDSDVTTEQRVYRYSQLSR